MKPTLIAFVDRSFRDVADHDYVLARAAYRLELHLQFIWLAQQAVEKYLKALLLYNNRSAFKLKHTLVPAFRRVVQIRDIPFEFPSATADFMNYLDLRASRYFEYPYAVSPYRLYDLDRTVWFLRRYCGYIRGSIQTNVGVRSRLEQEILRRSDPHYLKRPHTFPFFQGVLQSILETKSSKLRPFLVWNNSFFARRRNIRGAAARSFAANSDLALNPSIVEELGNRVFFSEALKRRLKDW